MISIDPAAMTEPERFAELAELLARGVQRHFVAQRKADLAAAAERDSKIAQNRLAGVGRVEAPCGRSRVRSPRSGTPA
ncbi:MAG: hypothetical protein WBL19_00405 [Minisyncoccia bacterium]